MQPPETLAEAFIQAGEKSGLGVSFWHKPGKSDFYSYQKLVRDGFIVADILRQKGLRPGEKVAIILPTHPDFYRAYFGIVFAGGVPTALYPPVRLGRIQEWKTQTGMMLKAVDCVALIADRRLFGLLSDPISEAQPRIGCLHVSELLAHGSNNQARVTDPGEIAAVQFSSGATGSPKPVALSHLNMLSGVLASWK